MDERSKFASHLCNNCLFDIPFWLPQLDEKLGVKSKAALDLLEGDMDSFSKLEEVARNPVERKALRKLLKIDEMEQKKKDEKKEKKKEGKLKLVKRKEKANEKKAQQKKELCERDERAQEILKNLDKARSDGKDRNDKRVQKLEVDMCEALNVSPESWISKDKSLDVLISKLEERQKMSGQLQARDSLNDSMLLQRVSGGRALHGILLTKQPEDQLANRERLLKAPEDVLITAESLSDTKSLQFSSEYQEDNYRKAIDVLGHSFAVSANIPVYGAAIGVGASTNHRTEDEMTHKQNVKETYSSTVKFSTMEVASYSFGNRDLKLSKDPKGDLHKILKLRKRHGAENVYVEEACETFFHTYGSHVNKGPLRFGGTFWWTCSSKGFSQNETKTVKKMQSDAISTTVGISFAGFGVSTEVNIDKIKGSYHGKCSESTLASTSLQVRITGGPPETTDLSLWMTGLVANNSTWILTDRGKKLIPVWDIIRKNHKELGEISEVLRSTWEKMSGLKAERDLSTKLYYDSEAVLEEVSEWNEEENLTLRQIEDNLKYLLQVKKDILDKTGNPTIWICEYLSDPNLQEFLESVVDSATSQFEHIKFQMQMLFEPEGLKQFDTRTFPGIEQVSEWLYCSHQLPKPSRMQRDIPDFQSFDDFLEKTLEQARIAQLSSSKSFLESSAESQEKIAVDVSKGILSLRRHCQQTYDDVLITILVHPFQSGNCDNVITLNPITLNDLESMRKHFSEQRIKFDQYVASRRPLHLQAYLFKLAVDLCGEAEHSQFQQLLQQITQMMRALLPLEQELEICLDHRGYSLMAFKQSLQYLMTKPISSQPPLPKKDDNSHSLRDALNTETYQHKVSQDDCSLVFKMNPTVHILFKKLGLGKFYPKKLQLKDALCIRPEPLKFSLNEAHPTDLKQLPYLVLHKLMVYDVRCRSDLIPRSFYSVKKKPDDCDDYDNDDDDGGKKSNDDRIHPLDTLLALIFCSDEFLCQDLLSRLAKCQLSVPFILPDPFTNQLTIPLWAMRSIIKEWSTKASGKVVQQTQPIVNYPMPIVSFIGFRKQKNGKSKSIILNEVISESHSHFFHRDCPGGHYNCLLGKGLVDMCWYLPTGLAADAFADAVTFLNLHGDARQHLQQSEFLSKISFMCIVLLTEEVTESDKETMEILKMFSSCPGGITLLDNVGENPKRVKEEIPGVYAINLTKKNASEVKCSIRERIKGKLANEKHFQSIEDSCKIKQKIIFVDEDSDSHKEGVSLANEVNSIITGGTKETMLPLQGKDLWQSWAAENRELHRQIHRGAQTVNDYTADMKRKKVALRKQQMEHVESLTPVMESFIVSLLKLGGPSNSILRNCFLQCLKLKLDNVSRENVSGMQHEYQTLKRELTNFDKRVSQKAEVKTKIKQRKDKMKVLQDGIINASIGLEHLFREVGQVYEAACAVQSSKYGDKLSRLPKAAAELLIDGYPLEVMDGDAAHVPLKWVTAVFNEAVKMLKNPKAKVFVLSVLGLQSTGKSTMLNTAFGLQFNVSAGRCTRGAFIQLLPLDETLRKKTKCDYVLVVDTEGLRAIELDPLKAQKHDNELATFVIGLANMTLINIYGEVPGDMDDILQTSVHAFLRMNRVKFYPSCQFVHQNAGSNVKSEVGRTKFTQKLNKFTVDAASEEHCEGQYETFNDVIMFDDEKDVHHFPGLWKGDPPMAPVNQGYSHSAQMLKLSCIEVLHERVKKGSRVGNLSLSSFHVKVGDLWNTLLKENFVFSFKNTLEITAYNSLETEYSKWDWTFYEAMLEWEQKAENEITTADPEAVPCLVEQKRKDLKVHVSQKLYKPLKSKMDQFFKGKQAEIMVQWKGRFGKRLINLSTQLQDHAEKHCKTLCQSREAISKIESKRNEYTKKITEGVQEYIASLKLDQEKLSENLENQELESSQLKEIHEKELFTLEKLEYKRKQLVTPDQVSLINEVIQLSGGPLTEKDLNDILVGDLEILETDQVKKILKMGHRQQAEGQLKDKFNLIWIDLVEQLPFVIGVEINVEAEVERKLTDFVYDSQGQLIELLQERSFTQGASLDLMLEKGKHYLILEEEKSSGFRAKVARGYNYVTTRIWRGKIVEADLDHIEALEITERIFRVAKEYLSEIEKKDTDFNAAFTQELIHILNLKINEELAAIKGHLSFTREYILEIFLTACSYAVPKFKKMSESFKERHDPRLYLEKHVKGPLFTKFKNQYYQAEAEEAIANTLCAHLEQPIKTQLGNKLGSKMAGLMKASKQHVHFSSKKALKVKILTDIHEEDKLESYMSYITDVKECLEEWLKYYTIEFCDEKVHGESTNLQAAAKVEVTRFIEVVEKEVNGLAETDVHQWVTIFSKDAKLRSELAVNLEADDLLAGYESLQLNLVNLKCQIRARLKELENKLHASFDSIQCSPEMDRWKDKPHDLLEPLIGCTEQCPFCGEQCDLLDPNHVATGRDHSVSVHRSICLQGYKDVETRIMMIGFCPAYISGKERHTHFRNKDTNHEWHPYKDYQSIYPKWSIPPDVTSEDSLYWKMFVGGYMKAIAERYNAEPAKVPDGWSKITWEEVRENLRSLYKY